MMLRYAIGVVAVLLLAVPGVYAQAIARKPMRLILGFPPGGAVDLIGRAVAPGIGEATGNTIVVDNRPGANGAIGAELLAKSPADGSTIGLVSVSSLVLNPLTMAHPPYHALRDFTPIGNVGLVPFVVTAHPSVPAKSLRELIALARARPGQVTIGSPGVGGLQHLGIVMLNDAARIKLLHVPYKGTGPAMTDVLGGHIDALMAAVSGVLSAAKAGKLKVLAITSAERSPLLPDVPTVREQGLAGYLVVNWYAIVAPASLPAAALDALHAALVKTVATAAVRDKLVASGVEPKSDESPGAFAAFVREELARWEKVVKQSDMKRQ
ncbi:MAG: tripartite tricarboxylate transporter substrate binding protein [Burkholderiales bacterium]|nr:tripartite tricarboxylate transporter substrate binding protein [Burkholderiales bacterium]